MSTPRKVARLREALARIAGDFAPASLATSFGAEDMVLTDLIAREFPAIAIFTIDTGRLPAETLALRREVETRYGVAVTTWSPQPDAVLDYVAGRKACCAIRKVEPLGRALAGLRGWITGLRRDQAPTRAEVREHEFDAAHGLFKFNPLADWTHEDVWDYLRRNAVPVNALHARGYPSIGCEPCTRAVRPGEDPRAGRWWWESRDTTECGLHPVVPLVPAPASHAGTQATP